MALNSCRAVFMRGGTSKALVFREADLPDSRGDRDALFLAAMGSPDPNGRQLDGMGGGLSSLSKVCIVAPSRRDDADVDFTFVQVWIDKAEVDYSGTCGNMSSAIGPFAVDEGLIAVPVDGEASVRVFNTNTSKVFVARFPVRDGRSVTEGDLVVDGVTGSGAAIRLDFNDPAGSKTGRLLPTGRPVDTIAIPGIGELAISLVDASNPNAFIAASDVGLIGTELPSVIERNSELLAKLELIRRHAAVAMRLAPSLADAASMSIPRLGMLSVPVDQALLSGRIMKATEADIVVRMMSSGQPHRASPLTSALCLAVACRVPGTIAHRLTGAVDAAVPLRIGHPSGAIMVDADTRTEHGATSVSRVTMYRTARRLFQGEVLFSPASPGVSGRQAA